MPQGRFHFGRQSKMCHCHDNLALRPEVAKKINIKNETGIHPDTLLDLREKATQKKSSQGGNFPF